MIYYIVPPIIMIVTLALFIFFISKKMNKIPKPVEIKTEDATAALQSGMKEALKHKVSHFFLQVLEKMTKRFKLMSLKSHNSLENLSKKIREKKENRLRAREDMKQQQEKALTESKIETENIYGSEPAKNAIEEILKSETFSEAKKEKIVPPMVSEKAVHPEPEENVKSEYENSLIERIAMNPRDIEAYERLGDYYVEQGNPTDAVECFKQVVKLSPGNRKAKLAVRKLDKKKI